MVPDGKVLQRLLFSSLGLLLVADIMRLHVSANLHTPQRVAGAPGIVGGEPKPDPGRLCLHYLSFHSITSMRSAITPRRAGSATGRVYLLIWELTRWGTKCEC